MALSQSFCNFACLIGASIVDKHYLPTIKMIEGMKIFTSYTNAWKSKELVTESRKRFRELLEPYWTELA